MLAKEIDKSPDARTYRTVAVIDCTEWRRIALATLSVH